VYTQAFHLQLKIIRWSNGWHARLKCCFSWVWVSRVKPRL